MTERPGTSGMTDSPEASAPAAAGPAASGAERHPLRTSLYLPPDMLPAVDRARAAGKSYADLIRDGLAVHAGNQPHEHRWECGFCHQAMGSFTEGDKAAVEVLAARERIAEEAGKAARYLDRLTELEAALRVAEGQQKTAASQYAELQAELEAVREGAALALTGEEGESLAVVAAAAAESELRSWRDWAAEVCRVLDLGTDTSQVIPWIRELRAVHGSPLPAGQSRGGDPRTGGDGPQAASVAPGAAEGPSGEFAVVQFTQADHDQASALARDRLADALGPPGRDLAPLFEGSPEEIPDDDWPSSFADEAGE